MTLQRIFRSSLGFVTLLVYLFMLAPALVVVVLAFNSSPSSTFPMIAPTSSRLVWQWRDRHSAS